jgi:predicted methyltransferase
MIRSFAVAAIMATIAAPAFAGPIEDAIAGSWRKPADKARDQYRHPAQTLKFLGVKPGQTVVEVSPGGGYWTEILAPYAMATKGRYVAGVADLANPKLSDGARKARADFEARFADRASTMPFTANGASMPAAVPRPPATSPDPICSPASAAIGPSTGRSPAPA